MIADRFVDRAAERIVRNALAVCDVDINGTRAWDIQVHDSAWYRRMVIDPSLHLGESYMDGQWDCAAVDEFLYRVVSTRNPTRSYDRDWRYLLRNTWARFSNPQSRARAIHVAEQHYDKSPELFRGMLDAETMSYTCGFWKQGDALGDAQHNKLRMICDKLALAPGDTLLDIGCGFGGLAGYAAENYGARVLGITNSDLHHRIARERCQGMPVEFARIDYREIPTLNRRFDKVASIEMIEAVGPKNFATYMEVVHRALKPGGRFVLQAFISDTSQHVCNAWFDRYIFPNGVSPSLAQLSTAATAKFDARPHVEDIGLHYPPTLLAWSANFERHWRELSRRFDERFRRMWHFYLLSLAGVFRARDLRLCRIDYQRSAA